MNGALLPHSDGALVGEGLYYKDMDLNQVEGR